MKAIDSQISEIKSQTSPHLDGKRETVNFLGNGAFGVVNEIITKDAFACKVIDLKKFMADLDNRQELCDQLSCAFSEFQIMKKNLHNVVRSYQCHFDENNKLFSYTMDLMKGGDLGTLIKKKSLPFNEYYKLFQDILTGKPSK